MNRLQTKATRFRWVICALLFLATTVNYLDRQVLSLTWKDFISPEFHWTDNDYGTITGLFTIFYSIANLFIGKFIDWVGTKKGYIICIGVWSLGAVMHAGCGWATQHLLGYDSLAAMRVIQAGGDAAVMISTVSVWLFLFCRLVLAVGESGNFPAAIKVTAEYFPKKDRAFSTAVFNSGASIGALIAPVTIPLLARAWGWEAAFVIIGMLGFLWMGLWMHLYQKPAENSRVNAAELAYIEQDDAEALAGGDDEEATEQQKEEKPHSPSPKTVGILRCLCYRQTWSYIMGKMMTDGVWWFFLFWTPAYFSDQYGYRSDSTMAILLLSTLYLIVTVLSVFGGYLPTYFVAHRGMHPYAGRMRAMLIFACFPLMALLAQPMGSLSPWWPAIIIGILGAAHQAWSANLYSTVSDMFPKEIVATVIGIGAMAGSLSSGLINKGSGFLFTYAEQQGAAFHFMGFDGKPAGYMIVFCFCSVAYLIGWFIMKSLVPKYKPIVLG